MRASRFMLATLRETPSDAVVISHQLMLRAGLIRKVGTGLYNWLLQILLQQHSKYNLHLALFELADNPIIAD